jgi:hypothetical protein
MYELVHGRKSGANTFFKQALYEEWKEFSKLEMVELPPSKQGKIRTQFSPTPVY